MNRKLFTGVLALVSALVLEDAANAGGSGSAFCGKGRYVSRRWGGDCPSVASSALEETSYGD